MGIIRDFVVGLPKACGVPDGLAEIYGELNGKLFDFELANPEGPLNRRNFEGIWDRIMLGIDPWWRLADRKKREHAQSLLEFVARTIDAKGGDWIGKADTLNVLSNEQTQPHNTELAALLPASTAGTLSSWD